VFGALVSGAESRMVEGLHVAVVVAGVLMVVGVLIAMAALKPARSVGQAGSVCQRGFGTD
jgi:MFS transporter, DHA2 family, methylenomycin A resistance protein